MSRTMQLSAGLVVLAFTGIPGAAQLRDPVVQDEALFELGLTKPFFEGGDLGFASSVLHARAAFPMGESSTFFVEGAAAYATSDSETSVAIANPRVGVTFGPAEGMAGSLSATLPVATDFGDDDFAVFVGLLSDPHRFETFPPDVWSVEGLLTPRKALESGGMVGGRLGLTVVGSTDEGDTELFSRYGAWLEVPTGSARLGAELSGSGILSEGEGFGDRTMHQVTVSVGFPESRARPELFIRVPVDDDLDGLDLLVGLRLAF